MLQSYSVNKSHMGQLLILSVYFVPFPLQTLSQGVNLLLWKTVLLILVLLVQITNHFIFIVDILLYFVYILWGLAIVFFLCPVNWFRSSFCHRKNILDCICYYEVFSRPEALHWLLMDTRNTRFLMLAIIWKILRYRKLLIPHSTSFRFQKLLRNRFTVSLQIAKCFGMAELGMSLKSTIELAC